MSNQNVGLSNAIVLAGATALAACLGYQAYVFLKHGYWLPVDTFSGMALVGMVGEEWAAHPPTTWIGAYRILEWFNAGAFAFMASVLVGIVVAVIE